ncbi:uncharacterized protein LOC108192414 [Daucus carota subsp. sativus]|nr:PREDICTED: uncharacterized protein LOC108192414 [Daucus carota subsp. sativus]
MEAYSDLLPPAVTPPAVQVFDSGVDHAAQFNNNPPYEEMITTAIIALKEKDGSSRQAIDKYLENVYKNLPPNHGTFLTQQLKKMKNEGKLVMNKHSYMLPGVQFVDENVGQVSVGLKRRPGRPPKVQTNGSGGAVNLEAPPASVGVMGDSGLVGGAAPFDPIEAVPNVVPIGEVDAGTVVKRRGRPPKVQAMMVEGEPPVVVEPVVGATPIPVGRRPGRPPKVSYGMVGVVNGGSILGKRGRGRPVKNLGVGSGLVGYVGGAKRGRGRPPKFRGVGLVMGQRPRGRPRKGTVARPRGRPRKSVPVNGVGASFSPVDGMGETGRPSKMAVRRNPRKLSGKPLGRPKKDASAQGPGVQAAIQQSRSLQDLAARVEHFQSRIKQSVGVVKSYLDIEVAPIAVRVLEELEVMASSDLNVELGAPNAENTGVAGAGAAPSSDQGGQESAPVAPLPV